MPIIWSGRLGPRSTGADRPACGELDAVAVADGLLTGAVRCYIAAMANPFEKRRRRNSIAVLAVLGGGVVVWWAGLLVSATVRKAFFADAALRGGWSGFILPDLLLLVGGGAAAMLAIRRDWPIVGPLLWLLLGGWAYALGWCLLMSVMTGQAWPAVGAMGLATLLIAALAVQWLPDDTAGRRLDPIKRTGWQIVAFWGGFLIAIPMTLLAIETAFGWRVGLFDGVIWRLDISRPDPADWDFEAFHDLFWDDGWDDGQPGQNPPILSTDVDGRVVVIQATGDIDLLDGSAFNVVSSITETVSFSVAGVATGFSTVMNWEMALQPGEQVTGPLELFDSRVFFGTFHSDVSATSACDFGESQLCGVHYVNPESSLGGLPDFGLESSPGSGFDTRCAGPFANQIIMGATVPQRPNCFTGEEVSATDPYLGSRFRVTGQGGGGFQLVAQVGGGGTVATGASVGEITQDLPAPETFTTVQAWLGATE